MFRKNLAICVSIVASWFTACDHSENGTQPNILEIRKLPVGLKITHSPNPVKAQKNVPRSYEYTWFYDTKVEALIDDLTIVEFGAFSKSKNGWSFDNHTGIPFNKTEFEDWYSCPNALIKLGDSFNDPQNWTGSDQLQSGTTIWYFIAIDPNGQRYYGEKKLDYLAEVLTE
ncbi:MAG: hypothetical protein AAGH99_05745 [Planctomycetota bacterium]